MKQISLISILILLSVCISACKSFTEWSYKDRPDPKTIIINGNSLDETQLAQVLIEVQKNEPAVFAINLKHIKPAILAEKLPDSISFSDIIIASDSINSANQSPFKLGPTDFLNKNKEVRKYNLFTRENDQLIPSFIQKIAFAYLDTLVVANEELNEHKISYGGDCNYFLTLNPNDLSNSNLEVFKDMIILIGDLGPNYQLLECSSIKTDMYRTPLLDVPEMNGTIIIANTIYTAIEHYTMKEK